MTILKNYTQFNGFHWETGTIRNFWDYRGVVAPHTNEPATEALLLGISGGAVMGYFSFAYEGYDPMARILTRNTFSPWDTMMTRLGVAQDVRHTSKPEKGIFNLKDTLASGTPAIVWADMFTLPYNTLPMDEGMWGMMPIVVYGYDEDDDKVWIADRSKVAVHVSIEKMQAARARVKKDKFRVMTLEAPNWDKLQTAVSAGIWDTIKLYTEKPPKGGTNSFGFASYKHLSKLLTRPKTRLSWEKEFPTGIKMWAGLTSIYSDVNQFGKGETGQADRAMYADFLDEASTILNKPVLRDAAEQFRASGQAWAKLGALLLPDEVPLLAETRQLMDREHETFLNQGNESVAERKLIKQRLKEIREEVGEAFPLDADKVTSMKAAMADHFSKIHDLEETAVETLQHGMN